MPIASDRILYSDDHLLAVNKRSGELVVRGKGAVGKLPLYDFLHADYPGLRVVHRLDFETSGVVVFARSKAAFSAIMNTKFDRWEKTYRALVVGTLPTKKDVIHKKLPAREGGLIDAETSYVVLENFGIVSLVEAKITTGRHHQIRQHFAMIKHPLVLDREYGEGKFNQRFSQKFHYHKFFLHASSVDFPHPITGAMIHIDAPMPRAFDQILENLKQMGM